MPLDNTIYGRLAHTWWAENGALQAMGPLLNPGRFHYFGDLLFNRLGLEPAGLRILDVGCGGGLLAEEFARLGCRVVGLDPSEPSINVARQHAATAGLAVHYLVAPAETLPFPDGHFDVVLCADALEHLHDLNRAIAAAARVFKPGGAIEVESASGRTVFTVTLPRDRDPSENSPEPD